MDHLKENYNTAINFVLQWEGGYVNNHRDPGGPTNKGITLKTAQAYWKPDATAEELKSIPMSVVQEIYRKRYADVVGFDQLPSGLDLLAFDAAVLSGPARAKGWLKDNPGVAQFQAKRLAFYQSLKTWDAFGKGWTNRINAGTTAATKLQNPGAQLTKDAGKVIATVGTAATQIPGLPTSVVPVEAVHNHHLWPIFAVIGIIAIIGTGAYVWSKWKKYRALKNSIPST